MTQRSPRGGGAPRPSLRADAGALRTQSPGLLFRGSGGVSQQKQTGATLHIVPSQNTSPSWKLHVPVGPWDLLERLKGPDSSSQTPSASLCDLMQVTSSLGLLVYGVRVGRGLAALVAGGSMQCPGLKALRSLRKRGSRLSQHCGPRMGPGFAGDLHFLCFFLLFRLSFSLLNALEETQYLIVQLS